MALTPDTTLINLVWRGVYRDNTPATGTIKLTYDGGVEIDPGNGDDKSIAIFPKNIEKAILPVKIDALDENGDTISVVVGQATFQVPATNDTTILGSGGTYTLVENLERGEGRTYSFEVDKDTPGGTIYPHEIPPSDPHPGTVYSGVSSSVFNALEARVQTLENTVPGVVAGTVTQVNSIDPDVDGHITLAKGDIGLSNVDNTADADKPVSDATTTALAGKADLVGGKVPTGQLPSFSATDVFTVASQAAMLALSSATVGDFAIRTDTSKTYVLAATPPATLSNWVEIVSTDAVTSVAGRVGSVVLTKTDVGLSNVDNTADSAKPLSSAMTTALAGKENTLTAGTSSQYYRGDKTWQTLSKTTVGLGNVNNTADVDKPVSTATTDAINQVASSVAGKAPAFMRVYNGTSWSARSTTLPAGYPSIAVSGGYPAAPGPSVGNVVGDIWIRDPNY